MQLEAKWWCPFLFNIFGVILKSELLSVGKRGVRVGREQWTDLQHGSADAGWATVFREVLGFLKDHDKIKLEGIVTTVDQKTLIGFLLHSGEGRGQIGPALLILQLKKLQWPEQGSLTDRKKWATGKLLEKQLLWNYTDGEQCELTGCGVAERFPLKTNMGFTWFMWGKRSGAGSVLQFLNMLCASLRDSSSGPPAGLLHTLKLCLRGSSVNGPCVSWWWRIIKLLTLTSVLWKTGRKGCSFF